MTELNLSEEERLYFSLKGLFESYGYSRFQMRRFEEYSLYLENLNFLKSRDIITFGGRDGRLLALKPDVTLSIVKNCKGSEEKQRKVYYRESVYRPDRPGGQFREISQIGLEYIGDVDSYAQLEVLSLASESLAAIGGGYVMDVSHMGALEGIANSCGMESLPDEVFGCMRARNLHDLKEVCISCGMGEDAAGKLRTLLSAGGSNKKKAHRSPLALPRKRKVPCGGRRARRAFKRARGGEYGVRDRFFSFKRPRLLQRRYLSGIYRKVSPRRALGRQVRQSRKKIRRGKGRRRLCAIPRRA